MRYSPEFSVSCHPFLNEVWLKIRPSSRNEYSCFLAPVEGNILSEAVLECAALVECKRGGISEGIFWQSAYRFRRDLHCGWSVCIESESSSARLTLTGPGSRRYSISVDPKDALELACQLWIQSNRTQN
jgi:hypothetical protein